MIKAPLTICSLLIFAGCANTASDSSGQSGGVGQVLGGLQQSLEKAKNSLGRVGAPAKKSSFDSIISGNSGDAWPRVALSITKLPPNAYLQWSPQSTESINLGNYCMSVSAVVWTDAKTSRKIDEESFCANQAPARWVGSTAGDFLLWSGTSARGPNTGERRTNGPTPPRLAFPQGSKYSEFPRSHGHWIMDALFATMKYDITVSPGQDRRVWIVSIPGQTDM